MLILLSMSCRHSTQPEFKNPTEFNWTIETLGGQMLSIWGRSPTDIYIGGSSGGPNFYHFDGSSWTPVAFSMVYYFGDIYGIMGFGRDIYTVGANWGSWGRDSSIIMHFDGSRWAEQHVPSGRALYTIWGTSSNDIWTGGHAGTLYHSDGTKWSRVSIDPRLDTKSFAGLASDDIYLLGTLVNDPSNSYLDYWALYHYDGARWRIIDSMSVATSQFGTRFGEAKLAYIGGKLYSFGYGIFKMDNDGWHRVVSTDDILVSVYVPSANTAYATGNGSLVYYFNGMTWDQLTLPIDASHRLTSVWSTSSETFIIGQEDLAGNRTILLRGR